MDVGRTEQEERLSVIFQEIQDSFQRIENNRDSSSNHDELKDITNKIKDCKTLIKDFEREARTDGVPTSNIQQKKRDLVDELNGFIALKKQTSQTIESRQELLGPSLHEVKPSSPKRTTDGMSQQELMQQGRKNITQIDQGLNRIEKVVEDTNAVGVQINQDLEDQTKQMERVVDDLNDMELTMSSANKTIRNITRGLLTDKFILCLLLLVVLGIVSMIVVKVVDPKGAGKNLNLPDAVKENPLSEGQEASRKLLLLPLAANSI